MTMSYNGVESDQVSHICNPKLTNLDMFEMIEDFYVLLINALKWNLVLRMNISS